VTSKVLLERLNDMGEYVKSASSTIEAPVVRRYQEKFPVDTPAAPADTAKPAATKAPAKPGNGAAKIAVKEPPKIITRAVAPKAAAKPTARVVSKRVMARKGKPGKPGKH
jgi:translation initiation factor IF-2